MQQKAQEWQGLKGNLPSLVWLVFEFHNPHAPTLLFLVLQSSFPSPELCLSLEILLKGQGPGLGCVCFILGSPGALAGCTCLDTLCRQYFTGSFYLPWVLPENKCGLLYSQAPHTLSGIVLLPHGSTQKGYLRVSLSLKHQRLAYH